MVLQQEKQGYSSLQTQSSKAQELKRFAQCWISHVQECILLKVREKIAPTISVSWCTLVATITTLMITYWERHVCIHTHTHNPLGVTGDNLLEGPVVPVRRSNSHLESMFRDCMPNNELAEASHSSTGRSRSIWTVTQVW